MLVFNCHEPWVHQLAVLGCELDIIDPRELQRYARILLEDPELTHKMGQQARKTVIERFSLRRFKHAFLRSIEVARRKWYTRKIDPATATMASPGRATI